jgi:hypothetical protein
MTVPAGMSSSAKRPRPWMGLCRMEVGTSNTILRLLAGWDDRGDVGRAPAILKRT